MELPPKSEKPYMKDPQEFLRASGTGDYEGVKRMFKEFVIPKTIMEGGVERALWNRDREIALDIMNRYKGMHPFSWLGAAAKGGDVGLFKIVSKRGGDPLGSLGGVEYLILSGIQGGTLEMVKFLWKKHSGRRTKPHCTSRMMRDAIKFPDIFRFLEQHYHLWYLGIDNFSQEEEAMIVLLSQGVREELQEQTEEYQRYGESSRYVRYRNSLEECLKLWGDAEGLVIDAFKGVLEPDLVRNILTFFLWGGWRKE